MMWQVSASGHRKRRKYELDDEKTWELSLGMEKEGEFYIGFVTKVPWKEKLQRAPDERISKFIRSMEEKVPGVDSRSESRQNKGNPEKLKLVAVVTIKSLGKVTLSDLKKLWIAKMKPLLPKNAKVSQVVARKDDSDAPDLIGDHRTLSEISKDNQWARFFYFSIQKKKPKQKVMPKPSHPKDVGKPQQNNEKPQPKNKTIKIFVAVVAMAILFGLLLFEFVSEGKSKNLRETKGQKKRRRQRRKRRR